MTKIAAADRQKVADLYASGLSYEAIAERFGVTKARVGQIIGSLGVAKRKAGRPRSNGHATKAAASKRWEIASLYESGMTMPEVAKACGISAGWVSQIMKKLGVAARPAGSRHGNHARVVRRSDYPTIAARYKSGLTLEQVGAEFGITRERVRQIVKKAGVTRLDGGKTISTLMQTPDKVAALRAKNERIEARIRATWDMSLDDYRAHVAEYGSCVVGSSPMGKYQQHRKNALARGIAWQFTFAEWWKVWQESGKWAERGRGNGYVMARWGDGDAPYSPDTVYICTQGENAKDSFIVHPDRRAGIRIAADEQIVRVQQMRKKHPHGRKTKLTADDARSIRVDGRRGTEIATTYGISEATVSQIKHRLIWKHV
jgi:transcriptional regulator with XRE-family HTH domain